MQNHPSIHSRVDSSRSGASHSKAADGVSDISPVRQPKRSCALTPTLAEASVRYSVEAIRRAVVVWTPRSMASSGAGTCELAKIQALGLPRIAQESAPGSARPYLTEVEGYRCRELMIVTAATRDWRPCEGGARVR
jgi:hypothetical protein